MADMGIIELRRLRALELATGLAMNGRIEADEVITTSDLFVDFLEVKQQGPGSVDMLARHDVLNTLGQNVGV